MLYDAAGTVISRTPVNIPAADIAGADKAGRITPWSASFEFRVNKARGPLPIEDDSSRTLLQDLMEGIDDRGESLVDGVSGLSDY